MIIVIRKPAQDATFPDEITVSQRLYILIHHRSETEPNRLTLLIAR